MFKPKLNSYELETIQHLRLQYLAAIQARSATNPASFDSNLTFLKASKSLVERYKSLMWPHIQEIFKQVAKYNKSHLSIFKNHAWKKVYNEQNLMQSAFNLLFDPLKQVFEIEFAKEPRISKLSYDFNITNSGEKNSSTITFSDGSKIILNFEDPESVDAAKEKFEVKMAALAENQQPRISM